MWDLPGPGIEHVSPELAGGFPTTGPTRKSSPETFIDTQNKLHSEDCLMNTWPQTVVLKLEYVSKSTGRPGKTQVAGLQPVSASVGLGWGLTICMSNKFPGDDEMTVQNHALRTLSLEQRRRQ